MKVARMLPPVGHRIAIGAACDALARAGLTSEYRRTVFEPQIATQFGARRATCVSSGKAALTLILRALHRMSGRTRVIIPAYTCYSVPSAIVKAGLEVVPCDLAPDSFDFDYEQLESMVDSTVLCVLSVHLFGIPSDTRRVMAVCEPNGVPVVEDAAQAFGCASGPAPIGTLGHAAFFSWGRGKNISTGSGGLILTRSDDIGRAVDDVVETLSAPAALDTLFSFCGVVLQSVLIAPELYWFPAGLPFLKLGETIFHDEFPIRALSDFQVRLLDGWSSRVAALNAIRRQHADYYAAHVNVARDYGRAVPYLRFPILLQDAGQKRRVLGEGHSPLGLSGMYPTTVVEIPQLADRIEKRSYPEAQRVVDRLVTLPTHPLLTDAERTRICEFINSTTQVAA